MISIVNRILQTDEELIHKLMNSNFSEESQMQQRKFVMFSVKTVR